MRKVELVKSRNPYFSGFSLAIQLNNLYKQREQISRNPYFSGFSLAISDDDDWSGSMVMSQSLF